MIKFDPFDENYKSPFGAVKINQTFTFNIECDGFCHGYIYLNGIGEALEPVKNGFTFSKSFNEGILIYYYFMLVSEQGIKVYIQNSDDKFTTYPPDKFFQLTVYETDGAPKWFQNGIMYQIFPDRFARENFTNSSKENIFIYDNWYDAPKYIKKQNGEIDKWDYFGGNIQGIIKKLDYLKEFNISIIYLNPIFESNTNHRYSCADYTKIDSLLGSEDDFKELIYETEKRGIKIILDGVFSHVGADSIYFNKFSRYENKGAYNDKNSPFFQWFRFKNYPDDYECWWNNPDLPNVDEMNESYIDYILTGENSIVKKWTKMGIGGWRLDVADEIPDEFLRIFYKTVKDINPDAIIIGEVWEDASNKIAYGKQRTYFTKRELDCVMNYPLRDNIIAFFKCDKTSFEIKKVFDSLKENYPHNAFYGSFNLLGSHDTERIYTVAKEICIENAEKILETMINLQFFFPGTPCIYYGDETGLEGKSDPDNRRTYPWGKENKEIMSVFKKASDLRSNSKLLKTGKTEFLTPHKDIFGIKRYDETQSLSIFANRTKNAVTINFENKEISVPAFGFILL